MCICQGANVQQKEKEQALKRWISCKESESQKKVRATKGKNIIELKICRP